jgi:hypothetical protein
VSEDSRPLNNANARERNPTRKDVSLKSHLMLKSHLFPKRLGLAHALLGVQGDAEAFRSCIASPGTPSTPVQVLQ